MIKWISLLQEFDLEIKGNKEFKNYFANHILKLEKEGKKEKLVINESIVDRQVLMANNPPWYVDIVLQNF